jgi:hypothetical protein
MGTFDDAVKAYEATLSAGRQCRDSFKSCGFPVPPRILALLQDEADKKMSYQTKRTDLPSNKLPNVEVIMPIGEKRKYTLTSPPSEIAPPAKPDYGLPPNGAAKDWVAMKAKGATPHSLVLAVLKAADSNPIPRSKVSNMVSELRGLKGSNAGYNALMELGKKEIAADLDEGWILVDQNLGGIIVGDILWVPESQLTDGDRANHRREAIIILLKREGKLLTAEISRGLKNAPWVKAGSNGNFVKSDMAQLERDGIVRRHPDKKWELTGVTG